MSGWWHDGDTPALPTSELVTSIGFLAQQTRGHIVLVQSETQGQHGNKIQIPRGMVHSMTDLSPLGTAGTVKRPKRGHSGAQQSTQLALPLSDE